MMPGQNSGLHREGMTLANAEAIWVHLQTINFGLRETELKIKIKQKSYSHENKFRCH